MKSLQNNIAKPFCQKIPLTLPSNVQMKWHFRDASQIVRFSELLNNYKSIISGVLYSWRKEKEWCAPPRRYYGNLNIYLLERMGTHAVTLSVLVTREHIILFCA